jgi:hypothetical protein
MRVKVNFSDFGIPDFLASMKHQYLNSVNIGRHNRGSEYARPI